MKENIQLNLKNVLNFISLEEIIALARQSVRHLESLNNGTGPGNDFLGWLSLPDTVDKQLEKIKHAAHHLRSVSDTTVIVGIGGSYLGAKAIIDALSHSFLPYSKTRHHHVFFAGQNICDNYMSDLLEILDNRNYSVIVISKSGTTTEPAIAFRLLKDHLERKVGKSIAADRIIAVTDKAKGALVSMSEINGYDTFVIPDDVGGRFSVLSPVGLLPVAVAGFDVQSIIEGAKSMEKIIRFSNKVPENSSLMYAAARNLLLQTGRPVEMLVNFTPKLHYFSEWWKQLFGESEGKEGKGIFPASADFTTDLHSMGQYIQEGQRIIFETFITINNTKRNLTISLEKDDLDQLNFLAGRKMSEINDNACLGTILAHNDGNVPVIRLEIPELNEFYLGQLIYFFETTCAISGYMLDINPFDQPGVEAYKKNMFALLNKPGFEEEARKINERLKG